MVSYYEDRSPEVHAHGTSASVPPNFQHWMTTKVYFHGFAKLPRDQEATHAYFTCLDHEWRLNLSPFGCEKEVDEDESSNENTTISLMLSHNSDEHINIEFGFAIKDANDEKVSGGITTTTTCMFISYTKNGFSQFMLRRRTLENLVQGALVVEVRMKPIKIKNRYSTSLQPFVPKNPSACRVIQDLFMHEESADVVFEVAVEVAGKQATSKDRAKVQKTITSTSPTMFYAHRNILMRAAPQLAELCTPSADETPTVVQVPNITFPNFYRLLLYIYGFEVPDLRKNAMEMIEVANKYGAVNLKLEAEAQYIKSSTFTTFNMMDHLLFADSMSCEALKEAVMDFIAKNRDKIIQKNLLKDAPAGLLNDIMVAMARVEKEKNYDSDSDEMGMDESEGLSTMRIRELRGRAHAKGLDVDGSREALIFALKNASSKKKC